ncbi:MAG: hypothetical protein KF809_08945 [Chloroflexi bacterium]|nr:hypothetical protein [Chloroflexota bacterium]
MKSRSPAPLVVRRSDPRPLRGARLTGAILALLACVIGHEMSYLVRFGAGSGYEAAMSRTGHDGYWLAFIVLVLGSVLTLATITVMQLLRLQREAGAGPVVDEGGSLRAFLSSARRTWTQLAVVAGLVYTLQENGEALLAGMPLPGPALLIGHDLTAALVILGATLIVSVVVALVRWRRTVLLGRLATAVAVWPRTRSSRPYPLDLRPVVAIRVASLGLRDPPPVGCPSIH